ncbi:DNA damage response protein WSS1 OS=Saccharomyces cerevisiae (strain ATCC 204508 / S288c) GN=WSS1 PE=1 SV=1 [Rhizoctonia solani AG-1 IB]|uniref:DNA damage response protein WSS1 n=1 Tax=Thanatephorus cucumeris (strain AG1-IB / isolate 7/3/14) TaxID=1108050 RepID=A0A0B7F6S8_THACB|nr:DNA damage response protein WSS1 OS=Saccharomyces cerevisiae (strain ATCC 204508 / S288c) GN=WSS1 PE=1 SV=1 [Rhizoctonia solani AG-1 IB]
MSLVRAFTHLANQPRAPEALHTLKRIADLAYPIMKRHGWVLPVLAEFFPEDERLLGLNINSGDKILIRVRPARSPGTFYPIEQLVRVMLHELTHNVHGPHDERFYSLLNKLEDEYDTLVAGGWRGSGFYAPGERLGSKDRGLWDSRSGTAFDTDGRRKALEAAEARLRTGGIRLGGRLGGSKLSTQGGRTMQELAAEAAERRCRDEQLCAASHPSADREAARAAVDGVASVVEDADLAEALQLSSALAESTNYPNTTRKTVVDLPTSYNRAASGPTTHGLFDESIIEISDSDSEDESISPRAHPSSNGRQCLSCTYINPLESARDNCGICEAPLQKTSVESQEELWTCVVCTLSNRPAARKCEACDFPKDRDRWAPKLKAPGDEGPPGVKSTPRSTWTCELCTLINVPPEIWSFTRGTIVYFKTY